MAISRRSFLLLAFCAASLLGAGEPDAKAPAKPVLLLTGFEPFGGLKVNASWETVKRFQGREILGHRIETVLLPVVYDEMAKPLEEALARHKPAAVISFGVGTRVMQVETVARNSYHQARPPDNKGRPPPRSEIVPGGAKEIATTLPVDAILAALAQAKIGAAKSEDAGGYLCNECYYRLMSAKDAAPVRGFVHVPDFGVSDPTGGVFDAERLARATEIVIGTVLQSSKPKP